MTVVRSRQQLTFARRRAHHRYADVVRGMSWRIAVLLVPYAAIAGGHLLWPGVFGGVFLGVMLTTPVWALSLVVASDPSAAAWSRGADAEDWTRAEMERHVPAGWRVVHDVPFPNSNADHVLIGRFGVAVIETKWRSMPWATPAGYDEMRRALRQCRAGAERVRRQLAGVGIDLHPRVIVVVWGGDVRSWTAESRVRQLDGDTIVAGAGIASWLEALRDADVLEDDAIARGADALLGRATATSSGDPV